MNERLKEMAEFIRLHQSVTLAALQKKFPDVSSMTLRRDLIKLEEAGVIVRIKGGARSLSAFADIYNKEDSFSKRIHQNVEQKAEIAQKAKKLIGSERSLYLDPGTTVLHLASCLPKSGLFLCTNGPNIALELLKETNCDVFLVGGQLGRENVCVAGPIAMEYIKDVNIELAFFAASGFTPEAGFTCANGNECALKRAIAEKAGRVIVLMDSSKLGRQMPYTFATTEQVDILVSDSAFPSDVANKLRNSGLDVI